MSENIFALCFVSIFFLIVIAGIIHEKLSLKKFPLSVKLPYRKIQWYGKTLMMKRGVDLNIVLTFACNLHCTYCAMDVSHGKRPSAKTLNAEKWKEIIGTFPAKIRNISLSGGEPTTVRWLPELTNWLIAQGHHVTIFTNLFNPKIFSEILPSYRLQVRTTFHHSPEQDKKKFEEGFFYVQNLGFNINVDEIETQQLPYSTVKSYMTMEHIKEKGTFHFSPNGSIHLSCFDNGNMNSGGANE